MTSVNSIQYIYKYIAIYFLFAIHVLYILCITTISDNVICTTYNVEHIPFSMTGLFTSNSFNRQQSNPDILECE